MTARWEWRYDALDTKPGRERALAVTAGVFAALTAVASIVLAIANAPTFHGLLNAELPAFDTPIAFGILAAASNASCTASSQATKSP